MDERVEEIKPISRIRPVRKLALASPRRGRREFMYQLKRYNKALKPNGKKLVPKTGLPQKAGKNFGLNSDGVTDIKKRIAFDRAMIIGEVK